MEKLLTPVPRPKKGGESKEDEAQGNRLVLLARLAEDEWTGFAARSADIMAACVAWCRRFDPGNVPRSRNPNRFLGRWLRAVPRPEAAALSAVLADLPNITSLTSAAPPSPTSRRCGESRGSRFSRNEPRGGKRNGVTRPGVVVREPAG
ncbi:MAG: hypothetical protein SH850_03345 [Planctomycetaceae bacterium]|nr:hypothetical protein [Planctomycetaceae bacterium]